MLLAQPYAGQLPAAFAGLGRRPYAALPFGPPDEEARAEALCQGR